MAGVGLHNLAMHGRHRQEAAMHRKESCWHTNVKVTAPHVPIAWKAKRKWLMLLGFVGETVREWLDLGLLAWRW